MARTWKRPAAAGTAKRGAGMLSWSDSSENSPAARQPQPLRRLVLREIRDRAGRFVCLEVAHG